MDGGGQLGYTFVVCGYPSVGGFSTILRISSSVPSYVIPSIVTFISSLLVRYLIIQYQNNKVNQLRHLLVDWLLTRLKGNKHLLADVLLTQFVVNVEEFCANSHLLAHQIEP